ncbi:MAG: F0F1 ATP synthase subunit gamma [Alphaproteobacteria bacterium]
MPSLKAFRNRIASVKATRKITRAMQMVAASKLRRAQDAAEAGRPYAEKMQAVIAMLAASQKDNVSAPKLLAGTGREDVHLFVVATADRGLCGGFNTNIVKLAKTQIEAALRDGKRVKILCVGRKGRDQLKRNYGKHIIETIELTHVKRIGFANARDIGRRVLERFDAGEFDIATLFFSRFRSVISQLPTAQRLIPAPIPEGAPRASFYEYEPDESDILAELLPRNVSVQIYRALLENTASFYGSQMSAMDSATRNAGDVIDRLTLSYNRTRQAMITKELIEIISGAEAL